MEAATASTLDGYSYSFTEEERARVAAIASTRVKDESDNVLRKAIIGTAAEVAFGLLLFPKSEREAVWRGAIMSRTTGCHYMIGEKGVRVQGSIRPQGLTEPLTRATADIYVLGHVRNEASEVVFVGWVRREDLQLVPSRRFPKNKIYHAGIEAFRWMDELWELSEHESKGIFTSDVHQGWDVGRPIDGVARVRIESVRGGVR